MPVRSLSIKRRRGGSARNLLGGSMKKVISEARKKVMPLPSDKNLKKEAAVLSLNLVKKQAKIYDQITGVEFGGSYAKDTWLAGDTDVDIFIKFNSSTPRERFVEISQKVGYAAMKGHAPSTRYSEHPYVEAKVRKTRINIVPYYDVDPGKWKSSADRSPYHTKNMKKALTTPMKKEVRLLKAFFKSAGVYGAEIARQGFSGYVSEVLVLNFGSFENTVKAMADMQENFVIGNTGEKFDTPIVIIDPIDKKRNLAAAISKENVGRLMLRCRAFERNPSMEFFRPCRQKIPGFDSKNILVVEFSFGPKSPETIWGQIKRASAALATQLGQEGFTVFRNGSYTDEKSKSWLFFLLESIKIPPVRLKEGPVFFRKDYAGHFIKKNIDQSQVMWVGRSGKIISLEERQFNNARMFLTDLLKNNQIGLPKGLRKEFEGGFQVFAGTDDLSESVKAAAVDLISTHDTFLYLD